MIKILFICHGNICRSAAAEMIMASMISQKGLSEAVKVDSAATSTEEIGNDIYPPMKRTLASHGVPCLPHRARRMRREDYDGYDLLIGMDEENIEHMLWIVGNDPERKIHLLLEYAGQPGCEISDPWYTRDFEMAYRDILRGCEGLLRRLESTLRVTQKVTGGDKE